MIALLNPVGVLFFFIAADLIIILGTNVLVLFSKDVNQGQNDNSINAYSPLISNYQEVLPSSNVFVTTVNNNDVLVQQ